MDSDRDVDGAFEEIRTEDAMASAYVTALALQEAGEAIHRCRARVRLMAVARIWGLATRLASSWVLPRRPPRPLLLLLCAVSFSFPRLISSSSADTLGSVDPTAVHFKPSRSSPPFGTKCLVHPLRQ